MSTIKHVLLGESNTLALQPKQPQKDAKSATVQSLTWTGHFCFLRQQEENHVLTFLQRWRRDRGQLRPGEFPWMGAGRICTFGFYRTCLKFYIKLLSCQYMMKSNRKLASSISFDDFSKVCLNACWMLCLVIHVWDMNKHTTALYLQLKMPNASFQSSSWCIQISCFVRATVLHTKKFVIKKTKKSSRLRKWKYFKIVIDLFSVNQLIN